MEPLVLIPGLLCTRALYEPQIAALGERATIVADHQQHETISQIAHNILEKAPGDFALLGLSMGGYIAMEIMRQAPERVTRLALLDTTAQADAPQQIERRMSMIKLAQRKEFAKIPELLYPSFVHADRADDQDLKAIVTSMAMETGAEAFVRQTTAIMNRIDSRDSLKTITCPTLVLVGDGDTLTPPERSQEMHNLIPGSHLEIIPGSGHLTTLEAPEQTNAAINNWLKN
ncbi:MAG: alpha/beta fold hydrolase [Rhodobacteraceae bacterium]|nr:alpha/beta fold hydrolase [Paracoccaceae bacterium]